MKRPILVFDTETYPNYVLFAFLNPENGHLRMIEMRNDRKFDVSLLNQIISSHILVGFNNAQYDIAIIAAAVQFKSTTKVKEFSDKMIKNNLRAWKLGLDLPRLQQIDLIEVAPGVASLKTYGGRLHCKTIQDLPYNPDEPLSDEQIEELKRYCVNDLETTYALYKHLLPQIELREKMGEQYAADLLSKSDAQIAEAVIRTELDRWNVRTINPKIAYTAFKYKAPKFLKFKTEMLRQHLLTVQNEDFEVTSDGKTIAPDVCDAVLDFKSIFNTSLKIQCGIGGIHSCEKKVSHYADDHFLLVDIDVTSYYPSIILNEKLYPKHLGEKFLTVYRNIVERRIKAKKSGDTVTADSLKITINGSFGKFGSKYSFLFSPDLMVQTTVTGQLSLLMLIETLLENNYEVLSANTDGIVVKAKRSRQHWLELLVWEWENETGFLTESTLYKALHSRDVNSYVAVKPDGKVKTKGAFSSKSIAKNIQNDICIDAIVAFLTKKIEVDQTIRRCTDIRKFLQMRKVDGGAMDGETFIGKTVRFYYSTQRNGQSLAYKLNGRKVARSEGAMPCQTLPDELPNDIDFERYINEAREMLNDVGVCCEVEQIAA